MTTSGKKGKLVCIGNQKGGVGKSTITSMIANYMHKYYPKERVLVVDADDLQQTLTKLRSQELEMNSSKENDCYNIETIYADDFEDNLSFWKANFDYIFVDLPGNLKQAGVGTIYSNIDYLLIPTGTSVMDINSTVDFAKFANNVLQSAKKSKNEKLIIRGFFNRIKTQTIDFKDLYKGKENFPMIFLESFIPESVNLQRYASTLQTYENVSYGEYEGFCKEVIELIMDK